MAPYVWTHILCPLNSSYQKDITSNGYGIAKKRIRIWKIKFEIAIKKTLWSLSLANDVNMPLIQGRRCNITE